jgi:homocysteine S-methyltransferase
MTDATARTAPDHDRHRPLAEPGMLADVVVLDGGLATTLEDAGHDLSGPLWSARLLAEDPDAIVAAHRAFLAAGAEVVTTASYQLSAAGLRAAAGDERDVDRLLARSVSLAREAIADHLASLDRRDGGTGERERPVGVGRPLRVAASVGPYGAALADGSEYRGGYGRSVDELVVFHAPRVAALVAAGPDLLAVETIPSGAEVEALAQVLAEVDVPAWVSVTVGPDGTTTPEGQPLRDALAPALEVTAVGAVGVNCCPPSVATRALEVLAASCAHPLVVYPNVGDTWDPQARGWRPGTGGDVRAELPRWLAAGARMVGGCCGTGPEHLARLAADLRMPVGGSRAGGRADG